MRRRFTACLLLPILVVGLPNDGRAQDGADALYGALALPEVIDIMRGEGLDYGRELEEQLFAGQGGAAWNTIVATLYDPQVMGDTVRAGFAARLDGVDPTPMMAFFGSELGQRIVTLELEARRALLDDEVEAAARGSALAMRANDEADERVTLLDAFIDVNDLVEQNVVGAMNANYAFFSGLVDGEGFPEPMSESDILADVWSQEPQIRADTIDWVQGYLALAYQPLSDDELAQYVDFSRTIEGQVLNQAIFGAFDEMYSGISHALGQGAARFVGAGQDI